MSYSQNEEESIILQYFDSPGRLLDIGAYDGRTFSNSLALLERGWHGVLVEASPRVFTHLMTNTAHVSVDLVNACIVPDELDLVTFYDNMGAVATMNDANHERWKERAEFIPITVMTTNVSRLLKRFGTSYDMVNIDVEGGSVDLFEALLPRMPEVRMWIVEHDGMMDRCKQLMEGWEVAYSNGENIIFTR